MNTRSASTTTSTMPWQGTVGSSCEPASSPICGSSKRPGKPVATKAFAGFAGRDGNQEGDPRSAVW
ncbi:MAG: hypothetical protein EOO70_01880 [Myxococcaceae bacterium]|nr:MAG: hypothetical protein EOO70_01880 [Myxococcaceae bacterium]